MTAIIRQPGRELLSIRVHLVEARNRMLERCAEAEPGTSEHSRWFEVATDVAAILRRMEEQRLR